MLLLARHEDGSPMSDEELRDELMTLLVAGHETTASSLAWAIERLVRHPSALARLREEAEAGGSEYARRGLKETLRAAPDPLARACASSRSRWRSAAACCPPASTVAPCIYLVHRRADVYPDPLAFRPERFLEEPAGTYTWIPFGGGVRRCLGASFALFEMRIVLQELVAGSICEPRIRAPSASCAARSPTRRSAAARSSRSGARRRGRRPFPPPRDRPQPQGAPGPHARPADALGGIRGGAARAGARVA